MVLHAKRCVYDLEPFFIVVMRGAAAASVIIIKY